MRLLKDNHPQLLFAGFVFCLFGAGYALALYFAVGDRSLEFAVVDHSCIRDGTVSHDVYFHAHLAFFVHGGADGVHHASGTSAVTDAATCATAFTGTEAGACACADAGPLAAAASALVLGLGVFRELRDAFRAEKLLDGCNKENFYGRLSETARKAIAENAEICAEDLCSRVLDEAYRIYGEMRS